MGPRKDSKIWDTILVSMIGLLSIIKIIVAGLDFRYGWTTVITFPIQLAGLLLALHSYGLAVWAIKINTFFSLHALAETVPLFPFLQDSPLYILLSR